MMIIIKNKFNNMYSPKHDFALPLFIHCTNGHVGVHDISIYLPIFAAHDLQLIIEDEAMDPSNLQEFAVKCTERREKLRELNTHCPICHTRQIELIDPTPPNYKCRECKHKWIGKCPNSPQI